MESSSVRLEQPSKEDSEMSATIRHWVQSHRYRTLVRQLRSLTSAELNALGIAPSQIDRLAFEASRS